MISHLSLKNWKNFKSVDVSLRDRVFLIGPNASGKSNFLDALRFLRDIAKPGGGLQPAIKDRGGISRIRSLYARQHPDVEIEISLAASPDEEPRWRYAIGIISQKAGKHLPIISYERVWNGDNMILERPDVEDRKDPQRLTQTHLEQINANVHFREISAFLESIQYLHLIPQLIRNPEYFLGPDMPGDPFGRKFLERMAKTQEKIRQSRLKKIENALQVAVPQLKKLSFIKDEAGVPHIEAIYGDWGPKAGKQREDQLSDGTLRLIGLLWALLESDSLLLLEEPEISLNSGIVSRLAPLIYKLQKQKKGTRQVILSTHSPDLLMDEGIGGEEVLIFQPGKEGTEVRLASTVVEIRNLLEGGLSIADAALPRTARKYTLAEMGF